MCLDQNISLVVEADAYIHLFCVWSHKWDCFWLDHVAWKTCCSSLRIVGVYNFSEVFDLFYGFFTTFVTGDHKFLVGDTVRGSLLLLLLLSLLLLLFLLLFRLLFWSFFFIVTFRECLVVTTVKSAVSSFFSMFLLLCCCCCCCCCSCCCGCDCACSCGFGFLKCIQNRESFELPTYSYYRHIQG